MKDLEQKLRSFFQKHATTSYRLPDIMSALRINEKNKQTVKRELHHLVNNKEIRKDKGKRYLSVVRSHIRTSTFESGKFGSGFVRVDHEDLYIPPGYSGTALPGDLVKAEISARLTSKSPEVRILQVLKRVRHEFVGEFQKTPGGDFVVPDSEFLKRQIFIPPRKTKRAREGHRVLVKISAWNNEYENPVGEISEIIGFPGETGVDVLSIAVTAGISIKFPPKVLREAKDLKRLEGKALEHDRKDFRNEEIFTIDPVSAKDFDDAVSLTILSGGNYRLGVYIADVSVYVHEGSALDREAAKRSLSVYLINKVIPMLPEKLSEDFCSLRQDEDRPVFCIRMTCTPDGDVIDYEICEGIIRSAARLTYEEAQNIIDGKLKSPLSATLKTMNLFAKTLREKRFKRGGLDFYTPEVDFKLNENGIPNAIDVKQIHDSNNLIEEFMLLANKITAQHKVKLEQPYRMSLPYVYRVHETPDQDNIREFHTLVRSLGCTKIKGTPGSSFWFQSILNYFSDKPEKIFIEEIALRSMMKAQYRTHNMGHFGLGFQAYTHFTSPIRRYPDLILHRLIKHYTNKLWTEDITQFKRKLSHMCSHTTEMEIRAVKAEREVVKLKKLEFMQDKRGDVYHGVISGVTAFGLFVELEEILVEGLVHVRNIGDDFYRYEEDNYRLVGEHKGIVYKLGDKVTIQIIKVNVDLRHLDFVIIE